MSRPQPRELTVVSIQRLTPNMQRVVLGGEALHDFPADSKSGYVKLQFQSDGSALTAEQQNPDVRPIVRSYTVREIDVAARQLTLDMMLHGSEEHGQGPGAGWALQAQVGDCIMVGGPGPTKLIPQPADFYFLTGDMTALPAIVANLELLPAEAEGVAIIEIASAEDQQDVRAPAGIQIQWVVAEAIPQADDYQPLADQSAYINAVRQQPWPAGKVAVWAASEFHKMRSLRQYFRNERGVVAADIYISSYWKLDRTDEQHKADKRQDEEASQA
ncbi:siderophore-interacting protein [Oceanobacter mangrovi]|uniref:siderophore-interacting protein n=1 Tax=Oceanobacter mangrovi TaxID=2862510 RepID=UPI001C8F0C93|nr:siderophore-interacting protein [Oceanobacter mangrovi]